MGTELKIAFVQDALPFQGGAEKVLAAALEVYPQAQVYTLVYNPDAFRGTIFERHPIFPSVIDRLPGSHRHHRLYLPIMPWAVERFDLSEYEIVISFSYAIAHAARTRPDQLHISYIHTPMRYAWKPMAAQEQPDRLAVPVLLPGWLQAFYMKLFRRWDISILGRTNFFLTNSQWTSDLVRRLYHRRAEVLYPPVDTSLFVPSFPRNNHYICVSRLVAHKNVDLVVETFNRLGYPLAIVGDGPERTRLQALAGRNIRFLGWQPEDSVAKLMGEAKAFVHAGEEDFGIALAEAQAAGCPVIALKKGAAPEIIHDGQTGLLFESPDTGSLGAAIERFESWGVTYPADQIRSNALRFDCRRFQWGLEAYIAEKWAAFQSQQIGVPQHPQSLIVSPAKALLRPDGVYERAD